MLKLPNYKVPHSIVLSSFHFRSNILLSALFSNTLNLCSSLRVKVQILYLYRTTEENCKHAIKVKKFPFSLITYSNSSIWWRVQTEAPYCVIFSISLINCRGLQMALLWRVLDKTWYCSCMLSSLWGPCELLYSSAVGL